MEITSLVFSSLFFFFFKLEAGWTRKTPALLGELAWGSFLGRGRRGPLERRRTPGPSVSLVGRDTVAVVSASFAA